MVGIRLAWTKEAGFKDSTLVIFNFVCVDGNSHCLVFQGSLQVQLFIRRNFHTFSHLPCFLGGGESTRSFFACVRVITFKGKTIGFDVSKRVQSIAWIAALIPLSSRAVDNLLCREGIQEIFSPEVGGFNGFDGRYGIATFTWANIPYRGDCTFGWPVHSVSEISCGCLSSIALKVGFKPRRE